jgi:hypothetical protein
LQRTTNPEANGDWLRPWTPVPVPFCGSSDKASEWNDSLWGPLSADWIACETIASLQPKLATEFTDEEMLIRISP